MSTCEQEMCPNWDGFGCPCEVLDLDKPQSRRCPDCGWPMRHDVWDGWSCGQCYWEENPL